MNLMGSYKRGRRAFRSAGVLALGNVSEAFLGFVRSIALARILSINEFGIAMALAVTASIIELITDIGLDRMAVRVAARKNADRLRNTLHAINLIRGVANGILLMALGSFVGELLHAPNSGLWFSSLAVVCVLRGFSHLEIKQNMQRHIYWPEGTVILVFQVVWTVTTIGLAFVLNDARCMAIGIIAGQLFYAVGTHLLATSRWGLAWDRQFAAEVIGTGLPLIPSSAISAANNMFDRFIIGGRLGPSAVGFYSAASMIAVMPRAILSRFLNNVGHSLFVNSSMENRKSELAFDMWAITTITLSFLCAVAIVCFMRPVLYVLYGPLFLPSALLSALLAADFIPKFLICLIGTPALAFGQTAVVFRYVLISAIGILSALASIFIWASIEAFVCGMLVGDLVALFWLSRGALQLYPYSRSIICVLIPAALVCFGGLAAVIISWPGPDSFHIGTIALHVLAGIGAIASYAAIFALNRSAVAKVKNGLASMLRSVERATGEPDAETETLRSI